MIEAGKQIYIEWMSDGNFELPGNPSELIKGVFLAMVTSCAETLPPKAPVVHK